MFDGLFDDGRQVATSAVFHQDIENTGISVDISVMVSYYVVVMQIFQNVSVPPDVD
jgi:hypothetical protein